MKNILSLFSFLFVTALSAQTTDLSAAENYVYTKSCLNEDCSKKVEAVAYSDGLGRSKQMISIKATPSGKDIVVPLEYDAFGRPVKSYLPIPQTGTQNGAIYTNPKSNASQMYGSDPYFYSESVIENSPVGKVLSSRKPGTDYQGHSVNYGYELNGDNEVKKYSVTTSWLNGTTKDSLSVSGNYNAGELIKTFVTNEDGRKTTEFKNGKGQTVLVRKENADTYYVYNKYGHLAYVVPPLAVSQTLSSPVLNDLCYRYKYDSKSRQVEKKIPGKGWEYMIYDRQDRLVASQDAELRKKGQWLYTKYDRLGRVAITGIGTGGARSIEQAVVDGLGSNNVNRLTTAAFERQGMNVYYGNQDSTYPNSTKWVTLLSLNYYDTYPADTPVRPSQILTKNIIGDTMSDTVNTKNLSTASYVKNIENDSWTKAYTWYDDKTRAIGTHSVNHLGGYTKTESEFDFAGAVQQTRVYHKRLSSDTEKVITQTFQYDSQNRLKKQWHKVNSQPEELLAENTYDELSRLSNKKVGNNLQSMDYTYNIHGVLTKINDPAELNGKLFGYEIKYQHPVYLNKAPGSFGGNIAEIDWKNASDGILKRYTYAYDGLGMLKDAFYAEPNAANPHNGNYDESLSYDLNGNIKTLKRKAFPVFGTTSTMADDLEYKYTGNRLSQVVESSLNDAGYEGGNNIIDYDDNGNMITMKDKGIQSIAYNYLDLPQTFNIAQTNFGFTVHSSLEYLYRADGAKLRKTSTSRGDGRGANTAVQMTDYLDGFQYSYMDMGGFLPCLTCRTESAFEEQAYKNVNDFPGIGDTPEWKLDFVPTSEGFYSFTENRYIYQYRDHLGNTRVSFARNSAGAPEILDTNNYYPFGLNHTGGNGLNSSGFGSWQSYKYNGKELQETGMFDYGARFYMPDLGRWGVIDPLAETSRRFTPYNYALNNPISFIDPDGRKAMAPNEGALGIPKGGAFEYLLGGGASQFGSFNEFLGEENRLAKFGKNTSGGGGVNSSQSGKKDGPGIIKSVVSFFKRMFGGSNKGAGITSFAAGATVSRVGTAVQIGEIININAQAFYTAAGTLATRSLWALPLMLNGDSQFAANSKGIIDIPLTTTDNTPEKTITLFRGVHAEHPELDNAYLGSAIPWGGSATAYQHNMGDNNSVYTSWSKSIDVANWTASRRGPGGVILKQSFPLWRLTNFNNYPGEQEMQVFGPVYGAQVIKPWGKTGTWTPYVK